MAVNKRIRIDELPLNSIFHFENTDTLYMVDMRLREYFFCSCITSLSCQTIVPRFTPVVPVDIDTLGIDKRSFN